MAATWRGSSGRIRAPRPTVLAHVWQGRRRNLEGGLRLAEIHELVDLHRSEF